MRFLTITEEADLGRRSRAGDLAARNELVIRHRPYVLARARRYWSVCRDPDLVQAGYLGLIEAANVFDPENHPRRPFKAIASFYVHKSMVDYLYHRTIVRIPTCQRRPQNPIPTSEFKRQNRAWAMRCAEKALNRTCEIDSEYSIGTRNSSVAEANESDYLDRLQSAMETKLTELEYEVIHHLFGIGCAQKSHRKMGKMLGLSHTAVWKIQHVVLEKLRKELASVS